MMKPHHGLDGDMLFIVLQACFLIFLACDELTGLFSMNEGYLKFLMLKQINNCAGLVSKEA